MQNTNEKPLDLDNFNLDEIVSGNPPRVNGLNFSVPFLKSYNITDPITNTEIQPNASGNTWQYPYINNGLPAEMVTPEPVPQVGFWENFRHAAAKSNSLVQGYKFLADDDQTTYPADEVVPDGWTAKKPESVEGFPDEYWDYLTSATSPYDLHARQQKARQQMQEDEKFAHGGLFSSLLGGLAGTVTDPLTYLLPMATGIKYTTLTSNVARNLLRAQPGFALSSLSTAGLEEANRVGANLQHLAKNAVIDYAFTNVLAGVGFGAGFYRDEMTRMYGLRNLMKIPPEGIKVDFETKAVEGGGEQFTGKVVLRPIPGVAMSAQKLDAASLYANEVMAQTGLFNTIVGKNLQDFLGWGFLASPVLKAANSEYNSVRAFFNRIAPISVRTTGEMSGEAVPFTAYEIATRIQDEGKKFNLFLKEKYFEANGISGANTLKGQTTLFQRHWQENLTVSEEEFNIDVARRLTEEGFVSKYSQCNEVGDALHEHFKGIGKRFADATGNEMFLDPINAFRYLPMNYWIPAIRNNEKGFWETIANQFALQDERIEKLQGPIKGHTARIDSLKNEIKALKEVNPEDRKILNLQNQIDLEQKNLELAEDRLVQELRDNKKNHVLLEDRVYFNTGEIKQLEELLKPVKVSEQKLGKQEEELKFAQNRLKENIQQIKSIEESKRLGAKSIKLGDVQQEIENINQELKTKIDDLNKKSEPIKNRQNKTLTDLKTKRDRIKADIRQAKTDKDVKAIAKNKQKLENIQSKILKESEGIKKSKADLRDQILNFRNEAATAKKEMRKKLKLAKKLSGKVQSAALDLDFLRDEQRTLRREVEVQQARFDRASNEYKNLKMELDELARNGGVDKKFFKEYGNEISFHEPKKPKLRAVFNSHDERILEAKKIMESIYNESPADILANVFGNQEPGLVTNPNYLKSRSVMIDQTELLGFMDPDLRKTINNYSSVMGKMIGVKEALPEFAKGPAFEGVILNMKLEYDTKKRELEDKILNGDFTKEQANKMRNKLDKNFDKEQKFMKDTLATYFGTYGGNKNPELRKILTGFRNLVAASKLGNVPLYIMQEFAGLMMKQGLMPFLSQGLGPLLRGIAQPKTAEEKIAMKEMASHAYIGMHSTFEAYTSKFINESEMSYPPVNTASENFGRITEKIAAVSQALYGTTMIANAEEAMVANAGQSEIMSWCYKYLDGTITDVQRQKAARYGLDLQNDAQIFVNNFENTPGAKKINDGYLSMYHKWQDAAAVEKMAMSMRRMVQDQVVQANKFTSPYWAQNEFLSTFFMFHGWAYGYLTKYAIPFMQRPDAEQAIGIALMTSMGMGIEAFRRFSNGKEMYDDDTKWHQEALKSLMDSGMIAGPYWQYAVELNNYLGVIPNTGPERFKNRKGLGQFNPILGYLDGARTVFQHTLRGDLTKGDMLTLQGLLPGMSAIPFRRAIGDYIRNSTLPDKRNEAAPWSWLQSE